MLAKLILAYAITCAIITAVMVVVYGPTRKAAFMAESLIVVSAVIYIVVFGVSFIRSKEQ
jgi:hypothetical protein